MASSSSNEHLGGQQRPGKLARHNSSFIGAIKNIVKAPLTWFANQDDADSNTPGKRRRQLDQELTEELIDQHNDFAMYGNNNPLENDDDQSSRRTKRMRLHSPPRRTSQPYLDPPAAALRNADLARRSSVVPRASSAVLPSTRATLSPRRHLPITRTMSIDPPHRTLARQDSAAFNFGPPPSSAESVDYEMAIDSFGDMSMPPSPRRSPRPSFRLRSSVTPQPQHQPPMRYISEPPPLNTLVSRPVFLRPPAQSTEPAQPSLPPTLGALVETVRATKPATRQHSSLLLNPTSVSESNNEDDNAPAEKALHQLDVYKTPLLPTRMRSSNLPTSITATTTPDMFKSRRKSHLILMQDDKDGSGKKRNGSSRTVNETKPYAGEGGMKKLLARRKQEAEEESNSQKEKRDMDTSQESTPQLRQPSPTSTVRVIPEPKAPTDGEDWFSTAASRSSTGSFFRVGRSTNRTHLARPARARFTANYDEDADTEDVESQLTEKRGQMAEEAKKMVPLFAEPAGFSFSLDVPPMGASKNVDPNKLPIASLPFSIAKSTTSTPKDPSPQPSSKQSVENKEKDVPFTLPASSTSAERIPNPEPKSSSISSETNPLVPVLAPSPPTSGGLPNFFANSKVLKDVKLPAPPPVMNFGTTTSVKTDSEVAPFSFSTTPSSSVQGISKPVNEPENPFWDGGKKKEELKAAESFFSFEKKENNASSGSTPVSLFGPPGSAFGSTTKTDAENASAAPPAGPALFSFNAPSAPSSLLGTPSSITAEAAKASQVPLETSAPKPMFGAGNTGSSLFGDASKAAPSTFFGTSAPQPTPSPLSFAFDAPATKQPAAEKPSPSPQPSFFGSVTPPAPAADAPKSLFGGPSGAPFSFGQTIAEKEEAPRAPFSFGAAPSTPATSVAAPKTTPFSFDQPSTTPTATPPISFSFSGGGSTAADVSNKSGFSFGQPSTTTPIDRPVTPPKNDNEFRMEESPTRDLQQVNIKPPELRPTIGGGPFSFGSSSSTSTSGSFFGGQPQTSSPAAPTPFSFGATSSNPFGARESKPEEPKPFGGFGQAAPPTAPPLTTSFSFGQSKLSEDAQRPLSGGGFSFGSTPTSTTAPSNTFSFSSAPNSNPFGQPATGSAPSSPSTFSQPSPFAFGAPAPPTNGAFSFGSQPASPAAGGHLALPPSGFGSTTGFGQPQQPSSPFSGPIALAPSTSGGGGSLFTIGAAPAPAPGGPRTIKKLPARRGAGAKR